MREYVVQRDRAVEWTSCSRVLVLSPPLCLCLSLFHAFVFSLSLSLSLSFFAEGLERLCGCPQAAGLVFLSCSPSISPSLFLSFSLSLFLSLSLPLPFCQ